MTTLEELHAIERTIRMHILSRNAQPLVVGGFPTKELVDLAVQDVVAWCQKNIRHNVLVQISMHDGKFAFSVSSQPTVPTRSSFDSTGQTIH